VVSERSIPSLRLIEEPCLCRSAVGTECSEVTHVLMLCELGVAALLDVQSTGRLRQGFSYLDYQ